MVDETIEDGSVGRHGFGQAAWLLASAELDRLEPVGGAHQLGEHLGMRQSEPINDPHRKSRRAPGFHNLCGLLVARSSQVVNEGISLSSEQLGRYGSESGKGLRERQLDREATSRWSVAFGHYRETLEARRSASWRRARRSAGSAWRLNAPALDTSSGGGPPHKRPRNGTPARADPSPGLHVSVVGVDQRASLTTHRWSSRKIFHRRRFPKSPPGRK